MPSDAAFREALDALIRASGGVGGMTFSEGSNVHHPAAQRLLAAEARVLALYAEREGEVYEVKEYGGCCTSPEWNGISLDNFKPGDHVRVRRCEEGE